MLNLVYVKALKGWDGSFQLPACIKKLTGGSDTES
jgi:hypothetical protein